MLPASDDSLRPLDDRPLVVAYLLWRYPAVSLTFVQREVEGLRRRGATVWTMAVRRAHEDDLLTHTEQESYRTTWAVLPVPVLRALRVHLLTLLRWPRAYVETLGDVLRSVRSGRPRALLYFAEAVLVAARLRRLGVRHVHVHLADVAADVARLASRFERARGSRLTWSVTVHGPDELREHRRYELGEKVAEADLVVAISDYTRAQLLPLVEQEHWDKVRVVHCGIDVDRWPRLTQDPPTGPLRLLSVGRLAPQKSHEVLIDAVARLRDRGVDVSLTIVGGGPSRERIEQRIREHGLEDRVRLAGAVGQDEVGHYFQTSDVFCLASVAEGLPVVLMEAMATGLPVVATRITGVPELVVDDVSGLLVPVGRADLFADAVQRLVDDPALRQRLAAQGKRAVREGFSLEQTVPELEHLLREVVHRR